VTHVLVLGELPSWKKRKPGKAYLKHNKVVYNILSRFSPDVKAGIYNSQYRSILLAMTARLSSQNLFWRRSMPNF
jgi:hypothetical protein